MKKQYLTKISRSGLIVIFFAGISLSGQAQTAPPIQWQRVIEGGEVTATSTVRAVKTSNGGYAVLAGKNVIRLSALGDVLSNNQVTGTYQDSTATYAPVRSTIALAPTPDGGAAVLALDALNIYYVTKLDASGNRAWIRPIANANAGSAVRITENAFTTSPDGGALVVGSFTDTLSYLTLTKLGRESYITGEWRVRFSDSLQSTIPTIRSVLPTADGGYLLVGRAAGTATAGSQALAIKLDNQYSITWKRTYPALDSLVGVVANSSGGYTAIGIAAGGTTSIITIAPNGPNDGNQVAALPGVYAPLSLGNDSAGNLTVLSGTEAGTSDFRLTALDNQSTVNWTKTFGGSGSDVPATLLTTDNGGYLLVGTTTSTNGDVIGKSTSTVATWVVKLGTAPIVTALTLLAPTYNCQTGAIVFNTSGGNGTPITYTAPGITRTQNTDNFGTVELGVRNDPKVLNIQATQSGQTVSYAFDFSAYCRQIPTATTTPSALSLTPPTYNCRTGTITFHTTGGDSTAIEFFAAGITGWTTNPNQVVEQGVRTAYDIQPITLMARQSGRVVMYRFDLKAECGRARIGVDEPAAELGVSVIGNPVRDAVTVEITGAEGQSLLLHLLDSQGREIEHRAIEQAIGKEQQTFDLRQQVSGVLLLRTSTGGQTRTVKVLKQ